MREVGIGGVPKAHVVKLAQLAKKSGVDGVVASVQEARAIRKACGREFLIVTPGVRPTDKETGAEAKARPGSHSDTDGSHSRRSGLSCSGQANPCGRRSARSGAGNRGRNRRRKVDQSLFSLNSNTAVCLAEFARGVSRRQKQWRLCYLKHRELRAISRELSSPMNTASKSVIVGTAGHIDHGKSALVEALTGTHPDRLAEEKRRGITIDLGFAFLEEDGIRFGFVDVPGHERFVSNMLAGAAGIDLVLLVIAADESIKPQTREHFDICRLLGVTRGVVALTKSDLVDADMLGLVRLEVEEYLRGSFLERAPIVPVSAKTGAGLDELKKALHTVAAEIPGERCGAIFPAADRPRVCDEGIRDGGDWHIDLGEYRRGRRSRVVPRRQTTSRARRTLRREIRRTRQRGAANGRKSCRESTTPT